MYHPLLMQNEVLRDLPALLDDLRPRAVEPAVLTYRSEAFAEDLYGGYDAAPVAMVAPRSMVAGLLSLAPLCLALLGAGSALAGLA